MSHSGKLVTPTRINIFLIFLLPLILLILFFLVYVVWREKWILSAGMIPLGALYPAVLLFFRYDARTKINLAKKIKTEDYFERFGYEGVIREYKFSKGLTYAIFLIIILFAIFGSLIS